MRKTLLSALVAGILTTLVAGPASADAHQFTDPARDLMVARFDDTDESVTYEHTSSPNGDIILSRFEHSRDAVTLYVRYREIYVPKQINGWYFRVEGSNRVAREIQLLSAPGAVGGRSYMVDRRGNQVKCKVASRINYTTNAVKLKFPRRCLGNPASMRVAHVTFWTKFSETQGFIYYDDPVRRGGTADEAGSRPTRWIKAA